jgi:hypothetical protein
MKKLLLLLPAGLFALSIGTVLTIEYNKSSSSQEVVASVPKAPIDMFTTNESRLYQVLRHGDEKALDALPQSLEALDGFLAIYTKQGMDISQVDALVLQYVQDNIKVIQVAPSYTKTLSTTDAYEHTNKKRFEASLDQIGLYELKATFQALEIARLSYVKKPSTTTGDEYLRLSNEMKTILTQLYLDDSIEDPLFAYINNHKRYFQTITSMYDAIGKESIERLSVNSYTIQTELQLLPKI